MNPEILIILPSFNEKYLDILIQDILTNTTHSLLIVDDGSRIPISQINDQRVFLLRHQTNLGQGAALHSGLLVARLLKPKYIITMDADLQHQVSDIDVLIAHIKKYNVDIVYGSRDLRYVKGDQLISMSRIILLRLAILFNRIYSGLQMTDAHNGLRVLNENAYENISLSQPRMAHASEILRITKKKNLSFSETLVKINYTEYSVTKGQKNIDALVIVKDLISQLWYEKTINHKFYFIILSLLVLSLQLVFYFQLFLFFGSVLFIGFTIYNYQLWLNREISTHKIRKNAIDKLAATISNR